MHIVSFNFQHLLHMFSGIHEWEKSWYHYISIRLGCTIRAWFAVLMGHQHYLVNEHSMRSKPPLWLIFRPLKLSNVSHFAIYRKREITIGKTLHCSSGDPISSRFPVDVSLKCKRNYTIYWFRLVKSFKVYWFKPFVL